MNLQVFQHRRDGSVDFYLFWDSYKKGFGKPDEEYCLGMIFNEAAVIPNKFWLKISINVNPIRVIITT